MTSQEAVAFYHSLLRFGVQPGLDRIVKLCALLGDPQNKLKCVHVAGTNGKGSTCTEIASVLAAAGYKAALFTSPYVLRFEERIQINGELIPGDRLAEVTQQVKSAVEALNSDGIYPTEFEAITAAAFLYFLQENCDVAVLETGLGGRFDATNIIEAPLVSVLTSISMDHTQVLGDSIEKIAFEKCGIIKNGCAVVTSSDQPPEALSVIRKTALDRTAPLSVVDIRNVLQAIETNAYGTLVSSGYGQFTIPFPGVHQLENTALALTACAVLRQNGYLIEDEAIRRGIGSAFIPARTEIISREPLVILDGSHNEGSTAALADYIRSNLSGRRVTAVIGLMADKDVNAVLANLLPLFDSVIAVTPSNPRAMPADTLAGKIRDAGKPCDFACDPHLGIDKGFCEMYHNCGVLIVCGSLYLAADVRSYLIEKCENIHKRENLKGDQQNANDR